MLTHVTIQEGRFKGLKCTRITDMYLEDYVPSDSNGCGNSELSKSMSYYFTLFVGVSAIKVCCDLHDFAYSCLALEDRSDEHKDEEDELFEQNLRYIIETSYPRYPWLMRFRWYRNMRGQALKAIPDLYHGIVSLGGRKSYYEALA